MLVVIEIPQRPDADLSDLTSKAVVRRGYREDPLGKERYVIEFAVDLTPAEEASIRRRVGCRSNVEETLNARASSATQALLDFEGLATPTNPQILAAVRLQSRVVRALIRLELGDLDSTD